MDAEKIERLREANILTPKEGILREESLASWRLASNLTFNGFLINALFSTSETHRSIEFINTAVPFIGATISFSFLLVSLMGTRAKHRYTLENIALQGESKKPRVWVFYGHNFLGPYVSTNFLLFVFWLWYFFWR